MVREPYTLSDIQTSFVHKAANYVSRRYHPWGVTSEDIRQELHLWFYEDQNDRGDQIKPGVEKVRKWLASDPQQTTRIYRTLLDVALGYAEQEKANRVGYSVDDISWYSPSMVEALIPLVFDPTYDGQTKTGEADARKSGKPANEGGDLLAMVVDVRRAVESSPDWVLETLRDHAPGAGGWDDAVQAVINRLGGDRPFLGRRRVISNANAQAITRGQE